MKNNPECKRCGILQSTVLGLAPFGPHCNPKQKNLPHDFGEMKDETFKQTSNLGAPCPHCGKLVRVGFSK